MSLMEKSLAYSVFGLREKRLWNPRLYPMEMEKQPSLSLLLQGKTLFFPSMFLSLVCLLFHS